MTRWIVAMLLVVAPALTAQNAVPEIPFEANVDPLRLPPDLHFGEVAGVAVNSKGHVFVYNRGNSTGPAYAAAASQLLEFGPDGKFIREIGRNLYAWSYAHVVRVDSQDNIWAIDKGSDMIIKFNPQGRVEMVLGSRPEAALGVLPPRRCRRSTTSTCSRARPTSRSTRRATSSSLTAT